VRGLGPPLSSCSQASGERLPPCGARFANNALDLAHLLGESIALRVARPSARTRSNSFVAVRSAGARREASPQSCNAAIAPARPFINVPSLQPSQSSEAGDVGRFNHVLGRLQRPKTSPRRPGGSTSESGVASRPSKSAPAGRFNGV
jgi:hypothetical protein